MSQAISSAQGAAWATATRPRSGRAGGKPAASLHRRLVAAGVIVVLLLAVVVDVLSYVSVRAELLGHLEKAAVSQAGPADPSLARESGDSARRAAVSASLRRLVVVQALATVLALGLAALLFSWVANMTLRPLEKMLGVVRRQTAGERGERIRPDKCVCLMGVLGRAYDDMLDAQEAAIAETEAARERSRRFLADAAHQIGTPVAGIQAGAETLLRLSRPGASEQGLLTEMLRETSRVGRLVTDLLHASRLDAGVRLDLAPCDVVAVCRHEADRVQRLEPALSVTTQAPGWNGHRPVVDAKAVHDIVANLLDNARRHASTQVKVTVVRQAAVVEVRIRDDGPGLARNAADRVFERFVSLDGKGGSGLGLPIAQELARAHGGDLRYESHEFVLSLPSRTDTLPPAGPRMLVGAGRSSTTPGR